MMDFAMPFMIQVMKETTSQVQDVKKKHEEREKKEEEKSEMDSKRPLNIAMMNNLNPSMGLVNQPMLTNFSNNNQAPNYNAMGQNDMGMNQGGFGGFGNYNNNEFGKPF